jgi:manganese/iron transport system ATP-binding protein
MGPLVVDRLAVAYGRRLALREVSFAAPAGCLVGVIGPNGAGKSTLFKAILGVLRPSAGEVRTAGRPAYLPQGDEARLDLPLTALDVALMGRWGRTPWWRPSGRADRAAARRALAQVGVADLAGHGIGELSGGQRQRVLLARALAQGGQLMLLDEPLTGVDSTSQEVILRVLAGLRDDGHTILVATHDLNLAARTCDRLLFLNRAVIAYGPPEETFSAEVLAGTYGGDLLVVDPVDGRPLAVLDDASHH